MIYDSVDRFITELPKYMPCAGQLVKFLSSAGEKSFEELREMDFAPLDLRFGEYETKPRAEVPFEERNFSVTRRSRSLGRRRRTTKKRTSLSTAARDRS